MFHELMPLLIDAKAKLHGTLVIAVQKNMDLQVRTPTVECFLLNFQMRILFVEYFLPFHHELQ